MKRNHSTESGQAIVILVIGIIVLLGFTGLAIDGGMVFTARRQAQNASDAAALAGALQKANSRSDAVAIQAARNSITSNGYDPASIDVTIDNNYQDYSGSYILVTVVLSNTTPTNFIQVITGAPMKNVVNATARARLSQTAMGKNAIVAMGDCVSDGDHLISVVGGGNQGGVLTFQGGMFVNTPENAGNECAINAPHSAGTEGITAQPGYTIYSVGSYNYNDVDNISPLPVDTGVNGGVAITDPWDSKPEPTCTSNGYTTESGGKTHYHPGYYGGAGQPDLGDGVLEKGIYCIRGDVGGNIDIDARAGVVLYFITGAPDFNGNGDFMVNAPDSNTCMGSDPDTSASCTYAGFALFMARSNTSTIRLTGNGTYKITGLVYALNGGILANGGGTSGCNDSPDSENCDWVVKGQVIANSVAGTGNGSFSVTYEASVLPKLPTRVSLQK